METNTMSDTATATDTTSADSTATADGATADAKATAAAADKVDGADALGDAGKKALDAMKAERNKARDELKAEREKFAKEKAEADGKLAEYEAEKAKQAIKDEALSAANGRIKKAEVRAAAAGKLADPADALRFIDLSSLEVSDDGEIDGQAVAALIDDLVRTKPYLAAQGGKRFQGSADGGARNEAGKPSQLSREDLKGMSPEDIVKAKAEGRLNDALGIKST